MAKRGLYALPRTAARHELTEYKAAVKAFQDTGIFSGEDSLVAYVVTHCFDRKIPFKWTDNAVTRVAL